MAQRRPIMNLADLANLMDVPRRRVTYLATYNPLPDVVLVSGFDRKTHFYDKEELINWFNASKLKREPRG